MTWEVALLLWMTLRGEQYLSLRHVVWSPSKHGKLDKPKWQPLSLFMKELTELVYVDYLT